MKRMAAAAICVIVLVAWASVGLADTVLDTQGLGEDQIPAQGPTRALAGAVAANPDPLAASIVNPCASSRVRALTLAAGFVHSRTSTDNLGTTVRTVGSSFPTVAAMIPLSRLTLLAGLYVEKQGRAGFAQTDTLPAAEGAEGGTIYDADFVRETSVYSVPLFLSTELSHRLMLAGGIIFSFLHLREETTMDFRSSDFKDTDDVADTQTMGEGFGAAFLLDLGKFSAGGLYRNATDLDGSIERTNTTLGLWSSKDVSIASHEAFRVGLRVRPVPAFSFEADYDRTPWSRLRLDGRALSDRLIERWSIGAQYRGEYLWRASKYPLSIGFYRQPGDWKGGVEGLVDVGDITERVYSVGLSIPLAQQRAALDVAFEVGSRESAARSDLKDTFFNVSVSIAAIEPWTRQMKH
jgi:hypothetical protein